VHQLLVVHVPPFGVREPNRQRTHMRYAPKTAQSRTLLPSGLSPSALEFHQIGPQTPRSRWVRGLLPPVGTYTQTPQGAFSVVAANIRRTPAVRTSDRSPVPNDSSGRCGPHASAACWPQRARLADAAHRLEQRQSEPEVRVRRVSASLVGSHRVHREGAKQTIERALSRSCSVRD
jgi:hypothetical protein